MRRSLAQRAAAAAGALTLAVAGVLAAAVPASAALPGNIDEARDGTSSITVHKHVQPATAGGAGDGTEIAGGLPDPLDGVEFTLYQLSGIDLSTEAGWDAAAAISAAIDGGAQAVPNADPATSVTIGAAGSFPVAAVGTQETGSDGAGVTTFGDLDFGVYLVVEGADPGENNITTKAAPFIVSVPFATGENTWLYDVHAYPKNSVTAIVKEVTPAVPGSAEDLNRDLVRWNLTLDVPNLAPGDSFTSFSLVDTIDTAELAFVEAPPAGVAGNSFVVTDAAGDELAVPAGTLVWSPEPPAGATLTLSASDPAGLAWLAENAQGGQVSASVLTRLVSVPADGEVSNDATGNINDGSVTTTAPAPVGELEVFKYANTGTPATQTGLAGASFALYTGTPVSDANRVVLNGVNEWGPTGGDGYLKISSLAPGTYYLVETIPPTGYVLDTTPREVTIVAGQTVRPDQGVGGTNYTEVENQQVPPWLLPLTGADGTLWFTVGGVALLAIAAGAAVLIARRKKAFA